jgi:two-component system CheB/CheR fusion protein
MVLIVTTAGSVTMPTREHTPAKPAPQRPEGRQRPGKGKDPGRPAPAATRPSGINHAAVQVDFPIVGIGASAGGIEAFKRFFSAMPADSGMAFVLLQHLDPTHESLMVDLLAKGTAMKVAQVEDQMPVVPNHVFMIPPNKDLAISGGVLQLTDPIMRRGMRMPIDFFFRSLAEDQQEKAICVILSGTGRDGTLGLQAIKGHGGMAMAQAPDTAQYDGMPRSAIGTGVVDYVLPIEKMPEALVKYVRHFYINRGAEAEPLAAKAPDHLHAILAVLRARTKYDFCCYRKGTVMRRIERRMGVNHIEDVADYVQFLRDTPTEATQLFRDLLIGVTGFFREPEAFKVLEQKVIPRMVQGRETDDALRVWVPGCATGEEPYSIAMLLIEQLQAAQKSCNIQVFASDIDKEALEGARAGIYPESIGADVPPERLRRFFSKEGETYQVGKQVRECVVFALQNLISDPPFSKMDLISCRNLLIYLEPDVQKKVVSLFHFALREGGCLFLGNSETIGQQEDLFEPVSKKWRVYRRIGSTQRDRVDFPIVSSWEKAHEVELLPGQVAPRRTTVGEAAQHLLLEEYVPASVVINRKYEILYFYGPANQYLDLPHGEATLDLIAMLREGLSTKLRAAVYKAVRDDKRITVTGARVLRDGTYYYARVSVRPIKTPKAAEGLLLVTFEEEPTPTPTSATGAEVPPPEEPLVRQLEYELQSTKEDLQSTIEELETSNEELKVSNEEVMSMNEELRSTNEELETSKEELQSLNEELSTVNNELQDKVEELEATNNDLTNLLGSADIATIFLDTEFRIKRFTPASTKLFKLIATDLGRPISDVSHSFSESDLLDVAEAVLRELTPFEKGVSTTDGRWYTQRVLPYRTRDNKIDGVVITFNDVTELKLRAAELKSLNETLEERVAERTNCLKLLQDVAVIANQANSVEEAFRATLDRLCRHVDWPVGHLYMSTGDEEELFVDTGLWLLRPPEERFEALVEVTRQTSFRRGEGLVGAVIATGKSEWIPDVTQHKGSIRAQKAGNLGVKGGFAFPVLVGERVLAVMEFFTPEAATPDMELLGVVGQIGTELGRVVERTRAEEKLHKLSRAVEQSPNSVIITDTEGTMEYVNPAFTEVTGYSAEEAIGKNPCILKTQETPRSVFEVLWGTITSGKTWQGELRNRKKDGALYWDLVNVTPITGRDGSITHFLGIQTDITERKDAEEQARRREAELAHMARVSLMGEMVTTLAHELNQPLTAIVSYAEGAAQRFRSSECESHPLLDVLDQTAAMGKRAGGILASIRKFIHREDSEWRPLDINEVVSEAVYLLTAAARERGVAITTDLAPKLPHVEGDFSQLEQVVLNLTWNGIEAMEVVQESDRELALHTFTSGNTDANRKIELTVRDAGSGVSTDTANRMFETFFTTKRDGLGMGLSISRTIVEAHGGRLWSTPNSGRGTTFHLALPVARRK